jgi:hypothetical protein
MFPKKGIPLGLGIGICPEAAIDAAIFFKVDPFCRVVVRGEEIKSTTL